MEKLLKKQKIYTKLILDNMTKLFDIQIQIAEMYYKNNVESLKNKSEAELMDKQEVCQLLGISESTLARMRKNCQIPYVKLGERTIRYNKDEILRVKHV